MSSPKEPSSEKDEKKSTETLDTSKVHSANSWESADLGDDDRRKKFLRLMGASKTQHHGRFVIGDKDESGTHGRAKEKTDELNKDLENQYNYSQEHKITRFTHTGLGFEDKKEETREEHEDSKDKCEEKKDSEPSQEASCKDDRKRESTEPSKGDQSPPKKPKMMMGFVKASD